VSVASGSTFRPSQTATPRAATRGSSTRQGLQLKLCAFRAVAYPQAQDVAFSRYRDTDHHIDRLVADRSSWTLTPIALMKITGYDRRARVMRWGAYLRRRRDSNGGCLLPSAAGVGGWQAESRCVSRPSTTRSTGLIVPVSAANLRTNRSCRTGAAVDAAESA
jgi:hypothetical protein